MNRTLIKKRLYCKIPAALIAALLFTALVFPRAAAADNEPGIKITGYTGKTGFSVFISENKEVFTIGDNVFGQLGDGTVSSRPRYAAKRINSINDIVGAAAGNKHILALDTQGFVYSWGYNGYGQLGIGAEARIAETIKDKEALSVFTQGRDSSVPQTVKFGEKVNAVQVEAGAEFSLVLDDNGFVYAFGSNAAGQLGNGESGSDKYTAVPGKVLTGSGDYLSDIAMIAAGANCAYALDKHGSVYAWGSNYYGNLSNTSAGANSAAPVLVQRGGAALSDIVQISAAEKNAAAIDKDGRVFTWGSNDFGQIGDGSYGDESVKTARQVAYLTDNGIKAAAVMCGGVNNFILDGGGRVFGWGLHSEGSLGVGDYADLPDRVKDIDGHGVSLTLNQVLFPYPLEFIDGEASREISRLLGTCGARSFVLDGNENLWGFGNNYLGQAGNISNGFVNCMRPELADINQSGDFDRVYKIPNYLITPIIVIAVFAVIITAGLIYLGVSERRFEHHGVF